METLSDKDLKKEEQIFPDAFTCPITHDLLRDPVIAQDGFSYEREMIEKWFVSHNTSPMTGLRIKSKSLVSNIGLKGQISQWLEGNTFIPFPTTSTSSSSSPSSSYSSNPISTSSSTTSSSSSSSSSSEAAPVLEKPEHIAITITVRLLHANPSTSLFLTDPHHSSDIPKDVKVKVSSTSTVGDVKRAVIRATKGNFVPDHLLIRACTRQNHENMATLHVNDGDTIHAKEIGRATFMVKVDLINGSNVEFLATEKDKVEGLLWRLYRDNHYQPSKVQLWTGFKPCGDGFSSGKCLTPTTSLSSHSTSSSSNPNALLISMTRPMPTNKAETRKLSRIGASQQLFHAFISRTRAYDLAHHIGLVTFGTKAQTACEITPNFDKFTKNVDKVSVCVIKYGALRK